MKIAVCASCGSNVYFENVTCLRCGHALGFDSSRTELITMEPSADSGLYREIGKGKPQRLVRYCSNAAHGACNWLTGPDDTSGLCVACDLNRTIPNLSKASALEAWQEFERAKKRLVYQLLRFGLPLDGASVGKGRLTFDFGLGTSTGHLDGVISVDMKEADDVWREQQRKLFEEPYRTLLGHLRHESGHFYWMLLVDGTPVIEGFRSLFGDDRIDYKTALEQYHNQGAGPEWELHNVSAYAAAHPWEDWAETWAHYLHMIDALETAEAWGLEPRASGLKFGSIWPFRTYDVYRKETFQALLERWVPLTLALNSLSRSMGHIDFYPFVLTPDVSKKLEFVHNVIRNSHNK